MMNTCRNFGSLVALVLLSGCATTYRFKVDALADPNRTFGTTFVMEKAAGGDRPGSRLRYREAADFVQRALVSRGWQVADGSAPADMVITLAAKVSDPLTETDYQMEPVYYQTWGHTRIVRTPVYDRTGKQVRYVATQIYIPPRTRFAGYQDYPRNYTVYEKSLALTARSPEGEELWTLTVRTIDESSDLRSYIPLLAAAALPYVGDTTDGVVGVRIGAEDEAVRYLRGLGPAKS